MLVFATEANSLPIRQIVDGITSFFDDGARAIRKSDGEIQDVIQGAKQTSEIGHVSRAEIDKFAALLRSRNVQIEEKEINDFILSLNNRYKNESDELFKFYMLQQSINISRVTARVLRDDKSDGDDEKEVVPVEFVGDSIGFRQLLDSMYSQAMMIQDKEDQLAGLVTWMRAAVNADSLQAMNDKDIDLTQYKSVGYDKVAIQHYYSLFDTDPEMTKNRKEGLSALIRDHWDKRTSFEDRTALCNAMKHENAWGELISFPVTREVANEKCIEKNFIVDSGELDINQPPEALIGHIYEDFNAFLGLLSNGTSYQAYVYSSRNLIKKTLKLKELSENKAIPSDVTLALDSLVKTLIAYGEYKFGNYANSALLSAQAANSSFMVDDKNFRSLMVSFYVLNLAQIAGKQKDISALMQVISMARMLSVPSNEFYMPVDSLETLVNSLVVFDQLPKNSF